MYSSSELYFVIGPVESYFDCRSLENQNRFVKNMKLKSSYQRKKFQHLCFRVRRRTLHQSRSLKGGWRQRWVVWSKKPRFLDQCAAHSELIITGYFRSIPGWQGGIGFVFLMKIRLFLFTFCNKLFYSNACAQEISHLLFRWEAVFRQ